MNELGIRIANKIKKHADAKNAEKTLFYVSAFVGMGLSKDEVPHKLKVFIDWYLDKIKVAKPSSDILWIGFTDEFGYTCKRATEKCEEALVWPTTLQDSLEFTANWS